MKFVCRGCGLLGALLWWHSAAADLKIKVGEPVLLLDGLTVGATTKLVQRFYPAARYNQNPVLTRTEPWEGVGPYVWGNRLMQDPISREFKLWYIAYSFEGNFYRWGLAASRDGLHWTKPDLGVELFKGQPAKNCLPLGPHGEKGTRSIARDPRPGTSEARRYLGIRFTYDGEFVSFSSNGITWAESPSNPVWMVPSDIIHVMWDDSRQRFVAYYKVWEVKGTEIKPDKSEAPFLGYLNAFDQKRLDANSTRFDGPRITFVANGAAKVEKASFVLKSRAQASDDGGGSALAGEWTGKRVQAWAESDDGLHWKNERLVLRADDRDPPTANIQYAFVMQYGGYYLGFLTLHDIRGTFQIQLAWSHDGIQWHRPNRQAWLDIGKEGAFDSGMVLGPADPIIWNDRMAFPYGGFPITHDSNRQDWEAAVGLAMMRLDGFSAWESAEKGELLSQPFRCDGEAISVNAVAEQGKISVELQDERGRAMPGFSARACLPLQGDTLKSGDSGKVSWRGNPSLKQFRGKSVRLRFVLDHARLYSFRLTSEHAKPSVIPYATDH